MFNGYLAERRKIDQNAFLKYEGSDIWLYAILSGIPEPLPIIRYRPGSISYFGMGCIKRCYNSGILSRFNTVGSNLLRFMQRQGVVYWVYQSLVHEIKQPFRTRAWEVFRDGLTIHVSGRMHDPAKEGDVTPESIHVFDNGGDTYDRYTVIQADGSVFGASADLTFHQFDFTCQEQVYREKVLRSTRPVVFTDEEKLTAKATFIEQARLDGRLGTETYIVCAMCGPYLNLPGRIAEILV